MSELSCIHAIQREIAHRQQELRALRSANGSGPQNDARFHQGVIVGLNFALAAIVAPEAVAEFEMVEVAHEA